MKLILMMTVLLAACTPAQNKQFQDNLNSDVVVVEKTLPLLVALTDISLMLSGNGELIPLNDAGVQALRVIQKNYAASKGIDANTALTVNKAVDLGLQLTGDQKAIVVTDEVSQTIQEAVKAANPTPTPRAGNLIL